MTPRLAEILAEMVEFKLEADARRALGQRGTMSRARCPDRSSTSPVGRRQRGRP